MSHEQTYRTKSIPPFGGRLAGVSGLMQSAIAADYPARPVRLLVGQAAGSVPTFYPVSSHRYRLNLAWRNLPMKHCQNKLPIAQCRLFMVDVPIGQRVTVLGARMDLVAIPGRALLHGGCDFRDGRQ